MMETDSTTHGDAGIERGKLILTDGRVIDVTPVAWTGHAAVSRATDHSQINAQRVREFYEAAPKAENAQYPLSERPA